MDQDREETEKNHKAQADHLQQLATLQQSTLQVKKYLLVFIALLLFLFLPTVLQRGILYTNLAIILSVAVFLFTYFSINSFSPEQLEQFRSFEIENS